jgi:hypothetical protein
MPPKVGLDPLPQAHNIVLTPVDEASSPSSASSSSPPPPLQPLSQPSYSQPTMMNSSASVSSLAAPQASQSRRHSYGAALDPQQGATSVVNRYANRSPSDLSTSPSASTSPGNNGSSGSTLAAPQSSVRVRSRSPLRAPISPGHDGGANPNAIIGDRRVPSRADNNNNYNGSVPSFSRDRSDNEDARTPKRDNGMDRERTPKDDDLEEQMEREKRDMERERQRQRIAMTAEDDRRRTALATVMATRNTNNNNNMGGGSSEVDGDMDDRNDPTTDIPLRRGVLAIAAGHTSRRASARADELRRGVLDATQMSPAKVLVDRSRSPTPTRERIIPAKIRPTLGDSPESTPRLQLSSGRAASPLQLRRESPQRLRMTTNNNNNPPTSSIATVTTPPLIQSRNGPTSPLNNNKSDNDRRPTVSSRPSLRSGEAGASPIVSQQGMPPPHQGPIKRRPPPNDDHIAKGMTNNNNNNNNDGDTISDDFFNRGRPDHSPVRPGTTGHVAYSVPSSSTAGAIATRGAARSRTAFNGPPESPQSGRALSETDSPQVSMPSGGPSPSPTSLLPVAAFIDEPNQPMFRQTHVDYGRSPTNNRASQQHASVFSGVRSSNAHTPFSPHAGHGADDEATEINRPLTAALGRTTTIFPSDSLAVVPPQSSSPIIGVPPMGERHPAYSGDDFTLSESDDVSSSYDDPRILKDRGQEVRTEPIVRSESPRSSRMGFNAVGRFGGFGEVNASGVAMVTISNNGGVTAAASTTSVGGSGIAGFIATGDNDDLNASWDGRLAVDRGQEVRTEAIQRSDSPRSSIVGGFKGRFGGLVPSDDDNGQSDMRTSGSFQFNRGTLGGGGGIGGLQLNMESMGPGPLPSESPRGHLQIGGPTSGKLDILAMSSSGDMSRQSFDVSGGEYRGSNGLVIGHDRITSVSGTPQQVPPQGGMNIGGRPISRDGVDPRLSGSYGRGGLGGTLGGTLGHGVALMHKPLEVTRHNPLAMTGGNNMAANIGSQRELKAATLHIVPTGGAQQGGHHHNNNNHHGGHGHGHGQGGLGMDMGFGHHRRGKGEPIAALGTAVEAGDVVKLGALGSGQTGTVYRGIYITSKPDNEDSLLKNFQLLALKSVNVHDKAQRHQMEKELEAFANTNCPNILGFRGAWFNGSSITMALEYMDQGSLDIAVKKVPPLSEDVIRYISRELLKGLDHMHSRHQLHRDIKPANMLIDAEGRVKISDFGLVKQLDSSQAFSKTFVGTLMFLSPERIAGQPFSYPSDIWSIGISLIFLATGNI